MSNDKHRNSSSNQGEMESEMIDVCDLCCSKGPIHTIRSMGLCRTCDSIFDYILNAALEGFVTGSPPSRLRLVAPEGAARCTRHLPLGHAATVMIDPDDRAVEVENLRAEGRSPRSTCNYLQVAVSAKPGRTSPACTPSSRQPGDNLMAFLRVSAGSTPRTSYRSRPVRAAHRHTSGARGPGLASTRLCCALPAARRVRVTNPHRQPGRANRRPPGPAHRYW